MELSAVIFLRLRASKAAFKTVMIPSISENERPENRKQMCARHS